MVDNFTGQIPALEFGNLDNPGRAGNVDFGQVAADKIEPGEMNPLGHHPRAELIERSLFALAQRTLEGIAVGEVGMIPLCGPA